jgi:hypothetical protein
MMPIAEFASLLPSSKHDYVELKRNLDRPRNGLTSVARRFLRLYGFALRIGGSDHTTWIPCSIS